MNNIASKKQNQSAETYWGKPLGQSDRDIENVSPIKPGESTPDSESDIGLLEEEKVVVKKPPRYAVVLINDDYTPQIFVVQVLQHVFYKNREDSELIMWTAHTKGRAVIDIYTYDIARTKVTKVRKMAEAEGHPLECRIEAVEDGEGE